MEGITNRTPYFQQRYYTQNPYESYPRTYSQPNEDNGVVKLAASAGVLQGIAILLTKASEWCGKKLMQGKEFTSRENVEKIASKMLSDNKLDKTVAVEFIDKTNAAQVAAKYSKSGINILWELEPVAKGQNAFYTDHLKLAVAPKSKPSLILHELGHAITAHKGKFLKFLQKSRIYAASVPTALVFLNSAAKKPNGEKTFIEKHAFALGFLGFLPTILEEGLASLRGINAAKQVKKAVDKTMNLKPLKRNYAFAWLTYVIAGLGLGVAAKQSVLTEKKS